MGSFGGIKFLEKSLTMPKNGKGDPLVFFNIHFVANIKKLKRKISIFGKITPNAKKTKGGPSGIFQHSFCRKTAKKLKGTPWGIFFRKNLAVSKKMKGGTLWARPVWYVAREKGKNFLVQFRRPNGAIWCNNIL